MSDLHDVSVEDLRRFARGLVFDRHGAEDVVQEAWLAALRNQPPAASLGGWLAGAVRNLAGNRRREEARRSVREHVAARPEALPSAGESVARIEVLRRLLDALQRLDEPYRSAVMLRYFEDQPPRAIARRLGVPVNTARTHVRRGLERLRRDLDGGRGEGRQDCLAALVPFVGGVPWTTALDAGGAGVALMQKKAMTAGVLLCLLATVYFVARSSPVDFRSDSAPASLAAVSTTTSAQPDKPGAGVDLAPSSASGQREDVAPPATLSGAWVVRGHAFRKLGEAFPELPLRGRIYAGPKLEGVPLVEVQFQTDAAGNFAWPLEPPTELVTVQVEPIHAAAEILGTWDVFLPGDDAPERWTVHAMPLDCSVRGRVRDTDGRAVAGALVRERDRIDEQETTTDAEGNFELRIGSDSERRLRICAPGFAQTTITVDAQQPGVVQAPDVVLQPELRLRGRVLEEEGRPVAGARVEPGHPFFSVATTTDAEGHFELGTLDLEAEHLALEAHKEGYVSAARRIEREERTAPVELRLARGVRVAGRVSDPRGAPVWGAWISIGYTPWQEPRIEAWTDREGRFTLARVPSGGQTAWIWRTGFAQKRIDLEIPSDASEHALDVQLEESRFIGGVVLGEDEAPLPWTFVYAEGLQPGARDSVEGFQSRTGADGRFRIEGLPEVRIKIGALSQGRARVELEAPALDRDDLVLRMVRSAGFAGTVLDAVTGAPIPQFVVRMSFPPQEFREEAVATYSASWERGVTFTDPRGFWRLEADFEAGQVASFTIEAPGYAAATFDAVRTTLNADPADFVARLTAGTLVRGVVVEHGTGAPLAGARIRRLTPRLPFESLKHTSETVLETWSDSAGRFTLANVPTGTMSLAVDHPEHTLACDGPFEVLGAAPVERWIELGTGATVRGRLLDGQGEPRASETVSIYCLEGIERTVEHKIQTDALGHYALTGLTPGLYHIRWERHHGESTANDLVHRLELGPDQVLEHDLRPGGHATLTGTLEYEDDLPETITVMIMPIRPSSDPIKDHWAESGRATFSVDGNFEASDLEPGAYRVVAHVAVGERGLAMGSAQVEVPAEGAVDVRIRLERRR